MNIDLKKRVALYFSAILISAAFAGGFFGATYQFYLEARGLTDSNILLVNLVFMAVTTMLDPLTGPLGDRIGQRRVYLTGTLIWLVSFATYYLAKGLSGFILAEAIGAIGHALHSQAMESWLKGHVRDQEEYKKIVSRTSAISRFIGIPATLIGSWVATEYGYEWPWLLAAVFSLVSIGILLLADLKKVPDSCHIHHISIETLSLKMRYQQLQGDLHEFLCNRRYLVFSLGSFALAALMQPVNMYWPLIFRDSLGTDRFTGIFAVTLTLLVGAGQWFAPKIRGKYAEAITTTLIGFSIVGALFHPAIAVFGGLLHELPRGANSIIRWTTLQHRVPEEKRFTYASIGSSVESAGSFTGLVFFMFFVDNTSREFTWTISGAILIVIGILLAKLSKTTNV